MSNQSAHSTDHDRVQGHMLQGYKKLPWPPKCCLYLANTDSFTIEKQQDKLATYAADTHWFLR